MINGQALGDISKLRYGLFHMSFNGCEVISVCNALEYLGKARPIAEVLRYMRRFAVLFGLCGCNIYRIGKALKHFGVPYRRVKSAENSGAFIISAWTGVPLRSSIHTVFCVREGGKIRVYNRYNSYPDEEIYDSAEKIFENGKTLAIYEIN